jgi:uncharacterized protein YyaL (SSP411 family)
MGAAGRHPQFVSPLFWHTHLAEALVAARESNRAVLLVVGRQSCSGSRALVEKTISKDEIQDYVDAHYVCLAGDADAPEPDVAALVSRMAQHERTPLCLYVSPEGALMHSTSGGRPPAVFLSDLLEAPHRRGAR